MEQSKKDQKDLDIRVELFSFTPDVSFHVTEVQLV